MNFCYKVQERQDGVIDKCGHMPERKGSGERGELKIMKRKEN
jgi:hypothetical protein